AYAAFVSFAGGAAATLTYSGDGHFDSDEFCGWVAESGLAKDKDAYGLARRELKSVTDRAAETALKAAQGYGASSAGRPATSPPAQRRHAHFGVLIAS
ncbi:MAG: hypothetical protein ACREFQ_20865, partial [Stellaceae bacterium]